MSGPVLTDPLRCGGCGGDTFKLAHVAPPDAGRVSGGGDVAGHLTVTCTACGAVSELRPTAPALRVDWAPDNHAGVLCGGWRSKGAPP